MTTLIRRGVPRLKNVFISGGFICHLVCKSFIKNTFLLNLTFSVGKVDFSEIKGFKGAIDLKNG